MSVVVEGTCGPVELDKRTYLPGVVVKEPCPKCGAMWERDLGSNYLSYPVVGAPTNAHGYCQVESCQHEWPVMVCVKLTVEPA